MLHHRFSGDFDELFGHLETEALPDTAREHDRDSRQNT
jgi:hypothetical protein